MIQEQSSSQHHHHQHHQLPKYGVSATGVARASKKNKPKKIPQRGLGVAQLEKLRLEGGSGGGVSSVLGPAGHSRALLPLHHHPPPPVSMMGALPRPPADGGFSPVLWDPTADPMKQGPYKRMPPLPMVSTGLSLTAPSSHLTEPPSNQMYSSIGSRSSAAPAEEDRESAGLDRPWPFMFEGMTAPAAFRTSTTSKATPTVPFAAGRMVTREAGFADACPDLLSRHEFRTTNYFSSANATYSDWSPSDFAYCKNSKANCCAGEPAFLSLSAAQPTLVLPSAHLPEYSDFIGVMTSQGSMPASPSPRPFYSFLPAGPVRCERPLGECRADVSEAVDLELKL